MAFYDPVLQDRNRWWSLFTRHRKGFGHCSAFGYDPTTGVWIYVDWTASGLVVFSYDDQTVDLLLCTFAKHGVILEADVRDCWTWAPRYPLYCVSTIKHLIGLKSFAVTPWQLYRALKRRGAREMFTALKATLAKAEHEIPEAGAS